MALCASAWATVGESKAAINRVVKLTQSRTTSLSYVSRQVYTEPQWEEYLTCGFSVRFMISRIRPWRSVDFRRMYATWRTTISCWALLVLTNFFEGVEVGGKDMGRSSTTVVGTGFLWSLIAAWVPTKVVSVTDGVGVGEQPASSWSNLWLGCGVGGREIKCPVSRVVSSLSLSGNFIDSRVEH